MPVNTLVTLTEIRLPEFDKNRKVKQINAYVFDQKCRYDIIFGTDFLGQAGINLNFSKNEMEWFDTFFQ